VPAAVLIVVDTLCGEIERLQQKVRVYQEGGPFLVGRIMQSEKHGDIYCVKAFVLGISCIRASFYVPEGAWIT